MASYNKITIMGNLGRSPEVRTFPNGGRVAELAVATTERWKTKDGERKERTDWHKVVIKSDALVGIAEKYLEKGSTVLIEGTMTQRKYTGTDGTNKVAHEVIIGNYGGSLVLCDKAKDPSNPGGTFSSPGTIQSYSLTPDRAAEPVPGNHNLDDEIPF